jgi:tetratricopeptide (TPR) repeat protein
MNEALESSTMVMHSAVTSGVPMIEITGRHATSFTHLYRAEFRAALDEAEAGLALFDFDREREIVNAFSLSSSVCLRTSRAVALWMLGRVGEADMEWARMVQLGRDLQHPPSLAAALCFALQGGCYRYSYSNDMARLAELADELLVLAAQDDFFLWYAAAYTCRGAIAQAEGDHQAATRQMRQGFELFAQTGSRVGLVYMNVICAEAFLRMAEEEHAMECLDAAEAEAAERNEGLLAPEIWRVRGRLATHRGEVDQAERLYTEALERARAQEASSLELRAALDLYELQGGDRSPTARARLAGRDT